MKTFRVPDMSCGHCVARINDALKKRAGIRSISVNLQLKTVDVDTEIQDEEIMKILDDAGYPATRI